jgi:hypothetical protein
VGQGEGREQGGRRAARRTDTRKRARSEVGDDRGVIRLSGIGNALFWRKLQKATTFAVRVSKNHHF